MEDAKVILKLIGQGRHDEADSIARQMLRDTIQQAQSQANGHGKSVFIVPDNKGFRVMDSIHIRPEIYLEVIPQGEKPIAHEYNYRTGCWS